MTLFGHEGGSSVRPAPNPACGRGPRSTAGQASDIVDGSGYVTAPAYFDDEFGVVLVV